MKKIIHTDTSRLGRLHCDNPLCGYDLPESTPFGAHLIGYPCPECGMNMLTHRDYRSVMRLTRAIGWLNRWFGWLGSEAPKPTDARVQLHIHNDDLKITVLWRKARKISIGREPDRPTVGACDTAPQPMPC
jgi:hypothetical protein